LNWNRKGKVSRQYPRSYKIRRFRILQVADEFLRSTTQERKVPRRCRSFSGIMKSRHSRRTVPTSRSQYAFAFGARTGVRKTLSPNELLSSSSNSDEKIESRS